MRELIAGNRGGGGEGTGRCEGVGAVVGGGEMKRGEEGDVAVSIAGEDGEDLGKAGVLEEVTCGNELG